MILTLIGEPWLPSVPYLQLLCFAGALYPLHALNLNTLKVQGRSDLFLKLEVLKKMLAAPVIVLGVVFGIEVLIMGMLFNSLVAYFLNSHWSGHMIGYSSGRQLRDLLPSFLLGGGVGIVVFWVGLVLPLVPAVKLAVQIVTGGVLAITFGEISHFEDYVYIKRLAWNRIRAARRE